MPEMGLSGLEGGARFKPSSLPLSQSQGMVAHGVLRDSVGGTRTKAVEPTALPGKLQTTGENEQFPCFFGSIFAGFASNGMVEEPKFDENCEMKLL